MTTETTKKTIEILEAQLRNGTKPRKNGVSYKEYPPDEVLKNSLGKPYAIKLNQKDIARIKSEIEKLKWKNNEKFI